MITKLFENPIFAIFIIALGFVLASFNYEETEVISVEPEQITLPTKMQITTPYNDIFFRMEEETSVPHKIMYAIAKHESNLKRTAKNVNTDGSVDIGVMQLNSNYIKWYEEQFWKSPIIFDPWNAEHNIIVGARYIQWLYKIFNDWELVIMAYNFGPSRIQKEIPEGAIKYYEKVDAHYQDAIRSMYE